MTYSTNLEPTQLVADEVKHRARRWYHDSERVPVARNHDADVEPRYSSFVAQQIHKLGMNTPPRIIDVGCGEGLLASQLEDFEEYIGVDPDNSGIHAGYSALSAKVKFIRAGVENIPPSVADADIIVSSLNLALWDDPIRRCIDLRKRLSFGGRILIIDLLRTGSRIEYAASNELNQFLIDQHNASLTPEDLKVLCRKALPSAEISTFTDNRETIVPAIDTASDYGNLFFINYQEA